MSSYATFSNGYILCQLCSTGVIPVRMLYYLCQDHQPSSNDPTVLLSLKPWPFWSQFCSRIAPGSQWLEACFTLVNPSFGNVCLPINPSEWLHTEQQLKLGLALVPSSGFPWPVEDRGSANPSAAFSQEHRCLPGSYKEQVKAGTWQNKWWCEVKGKDSPGGDPERVQWYYDGTVGASGALNP